MKFSSFAVAASLPLAAVGLIASRASNAPAPVPDVVCGAAPSYPNAKPKEFEDRRKTFYNATSKKTEAVTFASGEAITFQCKSGFTTDGSKDGNTTFEADCTPQGYFKPQGVCVKASKCGPFPNITNAAPTGKMIGNKAEFACKQGYSLDGKTVVNGGLGKNRFFKVECVEFTGEYTNFTGECEAYAFMPASRTTEIYNLLTEALFVSSCKGSIKNAFGKGELPSTFDDACKGFEDSSAECAGLVSTIKGDFASKVAAAKAHDDGEKKDWYEERSEDRPGIGDEAKTFCEELWKLLEMPSL